MSCLKESLEKEFSFVAQSLRLKDDYMFAYRGKNLRSAMFFLSHNIAKNNGKTVSEISPNTVKIAAAIELLHTASLYHDDVIDNAKLRRNGTSANIAYGNATTVLFGDALFARAFQILSEAGNMGIIETLSRTANEMSIGEINHTINYHYPGCKNLTENEYFKIIEQKTALLFSACCSCGVLAGNNNCGIIKRLSDYGLNLGTAYQIIDDCIDLVGDEKAAGKTLKSDSSSGKFTLPIIYLLQEICNNGKIQYKDYPSLLDIWRENERFQNDAVKKSVGKIQSYINESKHNLDNMPESVYSGALLGLIDYVGDKTVNIAA